MSANAPAIQRKKTRDDADLDITPMIDITFLLLAFFVMVSKMDPQMAVDLPESQYGVNVPEKNCVMLVVIEGDNPDEFTIYKGRSTDDRDMVPKGDEADMEADIAEWVEEQFSRQPALEGVLIKGAGDVSHGGIELAKRGAGGSELARERQLYIGTEEKN